MKRDWWLSIVLAFFLGGCVLQVTPAAATEPPGVNGIAAVPTPKATVTYVPVAIPPAQLAAVQALADSLRIQASAVKIVDVTSVEWPDACLGVTRPDVLCAQVVTPGYSIILAAQGRAYEYHTNQDGGSVEPAMPALIWQRQRNPGEVCDTLVVFLPDRVTAGWCKPTPQTSVGSLAQVLSQEERDRLQQWMDEFRTVTITVPSTGIASELAQTLTLQGKGQGQPSDAEQQAILDFVQVLFTRLQP